MPRYRITVPALSLLIGGGLVCAERAVAQTTTLPPSSPSLYDPLAPPDNKTKRSLQKFDPNAPKTPARETTTFAPPPTSAPASGAGRTGFNSANTRRSTAAPPAAQERKVAPGTAAPLPSTTQRSSTTTAQRTTTTTQRTGTTPATRSYAQAPGQPPVQIGTATQPRPRKRVQPLDPYEPLGIRQGGIIYYPGIEFIAGYDTNPGREPIAHGATTFTVQPDLKVRSDWSRHEFKADLRGSYNWYTPDQEPSLNRPYLNAKAEGRVDVTHDTRIDLDTKLLVATDNPNSPNLQAGLAKLPIFTTFGGSAGLGHTFNRLDVSLKAGIERSVYQNSQLVDGTTASNEDRNYNQYALVARAGYELRPGIKPFVELQADTRKHDLAVDSTGVDRDSNGITGKIGTTFELSRLLTGEIAIGYTQRDYVDPQLETLAGIIGNASLTWDATALTKVRLLATSSVGESNVSGVSGILYRDVGVEVEHAFRRWLIGFVKGGLGWDDYVGSDRIDNRYYIGAGVTYKIDRNWQLKAEYKHEWLDSPVASANYTADIFLAGVRWQY